MAKDALIIDDAWWTDREGYIGAYPILVTPLTETVKNDEDKEERVKTSIKIQPINAGTDDDLLIPLDELEAIVGLLGYVLIKKENIENE